MFDSGEKKETINKSSIKSKTTHMNTTVNKKLEDALLDFYLEADKNTIEEILQEDVSDIEEYKKKRNKLLFMINTKAKKNQTEKKY